MLSESGAAGITDSSGIACSSPVSGLPFEAFNGLRLLFPVPLVPEATKSSRVSCPGNLSDAIGRVDLDCSSSPSCFGVCVLSEPVASRLSMYGMLGCKTIVWSRFGASGGTSGPGDVVVAASAVARSLRAVSTLSLIHI